MLVRGGSSAVDLGIRLVIGGLVRAASAAARRWRGVDRAGTWLSTTGGAGQCGSMGVP